MKVTLLAVLFAVLAVTAGYGYLRKSLPDTQGEILLSGISGPVEVLRDCARVLRPGGKLVIATSHRLFPTKAIAAWRSLPPVERMRLLHGYLERAGGFSTPRLVDRSPPFADPLWVLIAARAC